MDWYQVRCDADGFELDVSPPNLDPWTARVEWSQVERVCFEMGEFLASDTFYVFIKGREASYSIPSEALGASDLAGKLALHGLFPAEILLEAMGGEEGAIICFPAIRAP
jgi:hypothetical protein